VEEDTGTPKPAQTDGTGRSGQFSIKAILILVGAIEIAIWGAVWLMRR
jgi:hypothetical protein